MPIASDLDAVDSNLNLTADQKRLIKLNIKANALFNKLLDKVGTTTTFSKSGKTYEISFDSNLAALFGHISPIFIHNGDLVLYIIIKVNGVIKFPTSELPQPLMIRNPFYTDALGNENPLAAALQIFADLVS
jgi:hypothetical protein